MITTHTKTTGFNLRETESSKSLSQWQKFIWKPPHEGGISHPLDQGAKISSLLPCMKEEAKKRANGRGR